MQTKPDTQPSPEAPVDRRRHPRYRFSIPLTIRTADGEIMRAITIEISASGVSAITERSLRLNDRVELEPIAASKVLAVVRHNVGKVYGFEFLALSSEQSHAIVESCKLLPRYQAKSLGI
jgi:PilZ domain